MSFMFGAGELFVTPTQDANGNVIAVPTPVRIGTLQKSDIDISFEEKLLYGARQFPVAVARGKGKIEGKAEFADISGRAFGDLVLGSGSTLGERGMVTDAPDTVPSTPFEITITPPSSGTLDADLGVRDADTGASLTRTSGTPSTGEYSLAGAVYTFAAADEGLEVLISHAYTAVSTAMRTGSIDNLLMGYTPFFSVRLQTEYSGKRFSLTLVSCSSSQFSMPNQNDDFQVANFNYNAFANAAGTSLGYWSRSA